MIIKKGNLLILLGIILLGTLLRLMYFQHVTFGYDQARDALQSISILKDLNPKIIGPTTDIRGLFHSPLYWYIVSPFYFFSGGDPAIARIPMMFINILNIAFIYFLAKKLFNNEKIALLCSLFMSVSFEAVQYGRWLSNPPPALLTTAIFFYGLWLVLKNRPYGFPLMMFMWGLSVDFQFFLVYQAVFLVFAFIYLIFFQKKAFISSARKYYWFYIISVLPWIFYITAEIKFKFQGLKALIGFFTKNNNEHFELIPKIMNFVNSIIRNIAVNIIGVSTDISFTQRTLSIIILFLIVSYSMYIIFKKKKDRLSILFLLVWFLSPILIYTLEKNNSYFLNIGNLHPLILLFVFITLDITSRLPKNIGKAFLLFIIIFTSFNNVKLIYKENIKGETLFSLQDSQVLTDEIKIIDFTYKNSNQKMFSFNTLTNPLFMNTTWHYLYNWYGLNKYGYMPIWEGAFLDDFGKEIKFTSSNKLAIGMPHYLIVEPPIFNSDYITAYSKYENKRSDFFKVVHFGQHIVEERKINRIINFFRDDITNHLQD